MIKSLAVISLILIATFIVGISCLELNPDKNFYFSSIALFISVMSIAYNIIKDKKNKEDTYKPEIFIDKLEYIKQYDDHSDNEVGTFSFVKGEIINLGNHAIDVEIQTLCLEKKIISKQKIQYLEKNRSLNIYLKNLEYEPDPTTIKIKFKDLKENKKELKYEIELNEIFSEPDPSDDDNEYQGTKYFSVEIMKISR